MKIPFLELSRQLDSRQREQIDHAIAEVLDSGQLIGGPYLEAFESEFASYCGCKHGVGTGNGLDALFLALKAFDIGPGDEVIVPAHTFIATWLAVSRTGAIPVPVDIRPDTGNLDERLVEAAITDRTRAIVVVHLYGFIVDMDALGSIARQYNLALVEDAAQSHGARQNGRRSGNLGHIAAFSFYPTKNLGALGDGGMVTTNDAGLAERVRALRDYGRTGRNRHSELGYNSRLDPLQANILRAKLKHLDNANQKRARIARRYLETLQSLDNHRLHALINDPDLSVWHHFIVVTENRDAFQARLFDAGIGTDIHYPVPPYSQPCYSTEFPDPSLWPVTNELVERIVSLPIGEYLDDAEVDYICDILSKCGDI